VRVAVASIVGMVRHDIWALAGVGLVVAVLMACHRQGRWFAACWSSIGLVWPLFTLSEKGLPGSGHDRRRCGDLKPPMVIRRVDSVASSRSFGR
jgi:hypothetical protein